MVLGAKVERCPSILFHGPVFIDRCSVREARKVGVKRRPVHIVEITPRFLFVCITPDEQRKCDGGRLPFPNL